MVPRGLKGLLAELGDQPAFEPPGLLVACAPFDIDRSEVTWALAEVMNATGDAAAAAGLLQRGAAGLRQTAQHGMPAPWRDAFLHGNPENRRVLAAARVA